MSTWLTPPQVAERTGFSVSTLANWRSLSDKSGPNPVKVGPAWIKIGTRVRYDEAVVSAWMEQAA